MNQPQPPTPGPVSSDLFAAAIRRAQAEFREMPGLKLTEAQAARLLSFDSALCSAVLSTLVDQRFLMRTRDMFQRAS
jgi:hypothetical protein